MASIKRQKAPDKKGRSQSVMPVATTEESPKRSGRRLIQIIGVVLGLFVMILGVWIYYPRTSLYEADGLAIETDCISSPKASFSIQVLSNYVYDIIYLIEDLQKLNCHKIRLIVPNRIISLQYIGSDYLRKQFPTKSLSLVRSDLNQPVIDIDLGHLAEPPTQILLTIGDVRQDSFEKFRVEIPNAKAGLDDGLVRTPLHLWAVILQSDFEFTSIYPEPKTRTRQPGFEIAAYPQDELSEIDAQFTSPFRDYIKTFYNTIVIAIAASVVASWIYSKLSQVA